MAIFEFENKVTILACRAVLPCSYN